MCDKNIVKVRKILTGATIWEGAGTNPYPPPVKFLAFVVRA